MSVQHRAPNRRDFLTTAGLTLAASALPWLPLAPAARARAAVPDGLAPRPNIVLVVADDLGWNEVGAYGQRLIRTPHLDRLAAEGVRFTDFYAGGAVCAPSRSTLLTGLHTGHATVRQNPEPGKPDGTFAADEVTIAHVLRAVGYRTALYGKWGFSPDEAGHHSHPNAQGFDEFYGYLTHLHAHEYYPSYLWHDDRRVDIPENAGGAQGLYAPDEFARRALDAVRSAGDQPFFVVWSTNNPHSPQVVPDLAPYADSGWTAGDAAHAAQVTRLDAAVGDLLATLEATGHRDDTIVLFLGDNGPHEEGSPAFDPDFFDANGPFRGYKRNLLEGGIRVPAIAWGPGLLPAGEVSEVPWATWDVLPTFAALAHAPVPPYLDGLDMALPAGATDPSATHEPLYWWRLEPYSTARAGAAEGGRVRQAAEAVREGTWKAIRYAPGRTRDVPADQWQVELYDLESDPAETTDLASSRPDVATRLVARMDSSWQLPFDRPSWSPEGLAIQAPWTVAPGQEADVTVTVTNHGATTATGLAVEVATDDGWVLERAGEGPSSSLAPGASTTVYHRLVAPASATPGRPAELRATLMWTRGGEARTVVVTRPVDVTLLPPSETSWVSDVAWVSATNGWGPVERDASNGRDGAGDGPPLSIAGTVYEKGLGVHAPSEVVVLLGGAVDRFTAVVGIDDFSAHQGGDGSVVFRVLADDRVVFDSGLVTAARGPVDVNADVSGAELLRLVVTDGGNGNTHDHSSWASARIHVPPLVDATADVRTIAGTAYVAVRARNVTAAPLDVRLSTPFGSRTVMSVAPGESAYQAFSSRAAQVPPGTRAVVEVLGPDGSVLRRREIVAS